MSTAKTSSAKNIFDLLRTLPGVTVELNNNVKYKGIPATIYVDDQPAEYVFPKTEMIPVANVLKIELIDASLRTGEGKGGIINVKMKDLATDGYSGVIQTDNYTTNYKDLNNSDDFVNANYKLKKLLIFCNINYNKTYRTSISESKGQLNYNSDSYETTASSEFASTYKAFWNYGGFRFSPNKDTRIRLTGGFYSNIGDYNSYGTSQLINSTVEIDKYQANSEYNFDGLSKWVNASYYRSIDTIGKEISVWCGLSDRRSGNTVMNEHHYYTLSSLPVDSILNYETEYRWANKGIYGGLFYNHPINGKTRWNFSWNSWNQFKGNSDDIYKQNGFIDYSKTGYAKVSIHNQSMGWRIGTTMRKWKVDGGLSGRYNINDVEFTRFDLNSVDTLLEVKKEYLHFLPSATIVYSLDSLNEIKLTYSKSAESVWFSQLCDFIEKQNPRNWSSGNSSLKPTLYNNITLGFTHSKQKWNINADIFFSNTNNEVSYLTIPINDIISITTPANISKKNSLGIDLSSWVSIKEKCDINFSSSINHTLIESSQLADNGLKKKEFGYNMKLSTEIIINQKTSGTFYVNYFSREITFEGYNFDYFNSSVSLTRKFFNDKFLITLGVNNIFDDIIKHGNYSNYSGIIVETITKSSDYYPTYFATLKYIFKQGDRGTKNMGKQ